MSTTAITNNPLEDAGKVKIRNRRLDYEHLKEFNPKSCSIVNIEMPEVDTSVVHGIKFTDQKTTYQYHGAELNQIVKFKVVYMPLSNSQGMKLIPLTKQLVEEVLKDTYEPKTATIIQTGKDSKKATSQRSIESCVITGAEIEIDANDYVRITFDLQGLDNPTGRN